MAVTSVDSSTQNAILQQYIASQQALTGTSTSSSTVNSSTSSDTETSISKVTGNFNTFLKILTTQLQNQDPTSATDPNQFTQELVEFSGIEQQINTNSKLDKLISVMSPNGITPLLGYIGKTVEASADGKIAVQNGYAGFSYTLAGTAQTTALSVVNSDGKTVATMTGSGNSGVNRGAWNGQLADGTKAADGTYTLKITATDANGKDVAVSNINLIGSVTGIQTNSDNTTTLSIGDLGVDATKINHVYSGVSTASQQQTSSDSSSTDTSS